MPIARRTLLAQLGAAAALGTAAWARAQNTPDWSQVEQAARKEGKLLLYSSSATPATLNPVIAGFDQRYGVKTELLFARPTEIRERIRAEQAAGRPQADLLVDGMTLNLPAYIGSYIPHGDFPNLKKLVAPHKTDGILVPVAVARQTVLINSRLVKPEEEPKSWLDLLDPKWKGKILSDDPRGPGAGGIVFDVLQQKFGPSYHEKLAQQNLVISSDISINERRLAQGEFSLYIPFRIQGILTLKGLPIRPMRAKEGDCYIVVATARVKDAPRPNIARLFMNYVMEPEAQKVFIDGLYSSTVGASAAHLPPDQRAILESPLLGEAEPKGLDERRKAFGPVYFKS